MDMKEYIKESTNKIYNVKNKKAVSLELEDHILLKQKFNEEIGYDTEQAEDFAVNAMGSADDIADQFGKLHNDGINEFIDIAGIIIWLILFGGAAYFLYEYVFSDIGTVPICLGFFTAFTAIFLLASRMAASRQRKMSISITTLGGILTSLLSYFCFNNTNESVADISSLAKLIFKGELPAQNHGANFLPIIFAVVFLLFVIAVSTILFSLQRKYENFDNTRKVTRFNKLFKKILSAVAILFLFISVLFVFSFINIQSNIVKAYNTDYDIVFDISQNCQNKKEFKKYIQDKKYNFESYDDINFVYKGKLSTITIDFGSDKNNDVNPGVEKFGNILKNILLKHYPQSKEKTSDYTIDFTLTNLGSFKKGINSLSLSKLMIKDSDLDSIHNFTTFGHTTQEKIDFFKNHHPQVISVSPSNNQKKHNTELTFTFTTGNENNTFDTDFETTLFCENALTVQKQQEMVKQLLYEKPDISNEEIAKKLNVKIENDNEVRKAIEYYNDFFTRYIDNDTELYTEYKKQTDQLYKSSTVFRFSKDLYFCLIRGCYEDHDVIMFDSNTKFDYIGLVDFNTKEPSPDYVSQYGGNFRKIKYKNLCYFDLNGNAYRSEESIPYYTKHGDRYRFEIQTENGNDLYMLVGPNGETYESAFGYIDEEGYLVIDAENKFKKDAEIGEKVIKYHDSDGNNYTKCLETNWDKNGNLINFNDYLDY